MAPVLLYLLLAATPADHQEGKRLFLSGSDKYQQHDFQGALEDFTKAWRLDEVPSVLFNLAQCHRALSHWSQAAFFYRSYLERSPDAQNRAETLARIDEMELRTEKAKSSPPAAPPPVAAAPLRPVDRSSAAVPPAPVTAYPVAERGGDSVPDALLMPTEVSEELAPQRSHLLSLGLFGGAAIGIALGVAGAIVDLNYAQEKSNIESGVDTGKYSLPAVRGDQSSANTWEAVGIVAGSLALAAAVGGVLTW